MGEPREVMDRLTDALVEGDLDAVGGLYATDAVLVTPDAGELNGREHIIEYYKTLIDATSDQGFELMAAHETDTVAIDEGYLTGTNTGPLQAPSGVTLPATQRSFRVRQCDVAMVADGQITSHRLYYDQMEFLGQLGLLPDTSDDG